MNRGLKGSLFVLFLFAHAAFGIDFFFFPDTTFGNVGDTITLSGQIGPSVPLRGFTVYMTYDTNVVDLVPPPTAGVLIAGRQGLQFNYFDHVPIHPDRLEIGATVFSTDFWAGPGEIFQMRMVLRSCQDAAIASAGAPFFVDAQGTYPQVIYDPAVVMVCPRIPAAVNGLTTYPQLTSLVLRWPEVTTDYLGRPLLVQPTYAIFRQQIAPDLLPVVQVASTPDTVYTDLPDAGEAHLYYVITQTNE